MRAFWITLLLGTALVAFAPARAAAAPEHAPAEKKAEAGEHGKEADGHGGGAAKDPFAMALDLTIWTSVVFILLFLVLRAFAWKPILEGCTSASRSFTTTSTTPSRTRKAGRARQLQLELSKASEQVRDARRGAAMRTWPTI
jgi:hypothetical protein